jgi:hypothetical protein
MVQQFLDSELEVVVQSGFIYVPLWFDPSVDREVHTPSQAPTLIQSNGRLFVRAVSLQSLLENYPTIFPESYAQLRHACLYNHSVIPRLGRIPLDEKLKTILFHVMPHFIRGHRDLERNRLSEDEILEAIGRNIAVPASCYEQAGTLVEAHALRGILAELEEQDATGKPAREGPVTARELQEWIRRAVERRIRDEERARLREILQQGEEAMGARRRHDALLRHIAEEGSLVIDGFGFYRLGAEEYYVYKHTGEYALRDFYGRTYLFPDCRVGISTSGPFKPLVMEHYKHPFLEGHDSWQEICLRGYTPSDGFTAAGVIHALEEGINALLYGYSSRRRNGYHSLEGIPKRIGGPALGDSPLVEPTDYPVIRKAHILNVDFDDYRVSSDHPKVASGQVSVTNAYTL